ncbi:putative nucleotidyltransferase substrate binding domain-containing protein [Hydrogenophaga sp. A37]|uniref:putative nucleotidyltransferase substrate binding domain-containing protein n=1 Tax=Hydrogenophaga sp. A37 TaxID=1945864 RepID=UPI000985EA3B|nr:putative nucleotidyltransferase substrate binding domain-containing protein [Hydrogenophaga sp. A37]OOG86078.1 cyclic nucleotide-binding protein [Hydrogenophaga sp. A37]
MSEDAGTSVSLQKSLSRHRILGLLPPMTQDALARALPDLRVIAGERIADGERLKAHLYWLIEGSVQLQDADGEALLSLRSGELFGLAQGESLLISAALAETDCRYTRLDALTAEALCKETPALGYFLAKPAQSGHMVTPHATRGGPNSDPALNLMTTPVSALIKRAPITLSPHTSIRDAAQVMSDQRVSSVLIVEQGLLFGLITDRDLRNRVIAAGMDTARPIADIATLAPMSVDVKNPAFDALLLMARHNIHHVPVLDGQRIAGMITATDLTEQHSTSAVYLAGDIYKQTTVEGLQTVAAKVKRLQQSLAAAEASAYSTGHIVTAITDAITSRLLQLGEAQFGPAPVDYVWVAAGSQARNEQTAKSDQDNCMLLDDTYDEALHGAYFKALSTFVCDGLDACGYVYCPGEMMAQTDQWRQPRRRWLAYFTEWTSQPDPTALMLTCVFFDMRAIHGNAGLLDDLRRSVLQQTRGNSIFLAHMVGNALLRQPPLGMFKGFSTIRSGEHKGTIDLKHHGVVPIVDLARVCALAHGDNDINTHDRLTAAAAGGGLSERTARDLQDALEFLAFLRIQHQAHQMAAGQLPDNHINPDDLSNFERHQLKDAFVVVQTVQSVMGQRYRM